MSNSHSQPTFTYPQHDPLRDPHIPLRVGQPRPGLRFLKTFALAVAACVLLGMTTHGVINLGLRSHNMSSDDHSGPLPEDGDVASCLDGADWINDEENPPRRVASGMWEVTKSFDLPLDSEELYFLSRGSRSFGRIDFTPSDSVSDKAVVEVSARYNDDEVMQSAKVCLLTREDESKHGLGIFTPRRDWKSWPVKRLTWEVKVSIPEGTDLAGLSTRMPIFPHHLDAKTLAIRKLDLATSNAPIHIESLKAEASVARTSNARIIADVSGEQVDLISSNGGIDGTFNVTSRLHIHTSNGAITADVTLNHVDNSEAPVSAVFENSNGKIEGALSLRTHAESGQGGSYHIDGKTSNSPVFFEVADAPVDSKINIRGVTSNSAATARVHPAFEGAFHASTSNSRVSLQVNDKAEDPKGDGRKRHVETAQAGRGLAKGWVHWGKDRKEGNVELHTSNAPVTLVL